MINDLPNTLRLQPLVDLSLVHSAALAGDFPALLEQNQRGNTADAKLAGRPGSLFGVEFGKANLALPFLCRNCRRRKACRPVRDSLCGNGGTRGVEYRS